MTLLHDLVAARQHEAKALATLQVEKATIDGERKVVAADLGPLRYLAQLIGASGLAAGPGSGGAAGRDETHLTMGQ
jgi:hypothetical protein